MYSITNRAFIQFRSSRDLGLIGHPDDITNCSIDECETSNGYLSTTYKLTAYFKSRNDITGKKCEPFFFWTSPFSRVDGRPGLLYSVH